MRLLKTGPFMPGAAKLQLHEFFGDDIPPYCILSHTWANDEVLFDDVQNGTVQGREGSAKIDQLFSLARKDGHQWAWADTCCIAKTSSAELSEAINSMYVYYQKAECCYAYLVDVHAENAVIGGSALSQQFVRSRWFTRGWCLQELLAPRDVQFFSSEWKALGDKVAWQHEISTATRIDPDFLTGFRSIGIASVAKRMSWAATRQCTRDEDLAYCLMGLFDVNMPMLYGEGRTKAFLRLQEEIMKSTDDHSIFAWTEPDSDKFAYGHGLLAESPRAFLHSGSYASLEDGEDRQPFSMTNRGLHITPCLTTLGKDMFAAALECPTLSERIGFLVIYLRRLPTGGSQYVRVDCAKLDKTYGRGVAQRVFVRQNLRPPGENLLRCIQLRRNPAASDLFQLVAVHSPDIDWDDKRKLPEATSYAREWVPSQFPAAFKLIEPPGVTVVLLFRQVVNGQYFALLLAAATPDFSLGFHFREITGPTTNSVAQLPEGWRQFRSLNVTRTGGMKTVGVLKPAGDQWLTDSHRVGIDVHTFTDATRKTYYVDIAIEALTERTIIEEVTEMVKETFITTNPPVAKKSRSFFGMKKS